MADKKITIYDVAETAGVGIGTVSRVLNDNDNVSDKTREQVLEAIEELNYQPSGMARGLARQKTDSIGVIVPDFTRHFFVEVLSGVQRTLEEYDLDLVLFNVANTEHKEKYIKRVLSKKRVDGVLAITLEMTDEEVAEFQRVDMPLVLVDDHKEQVSSISVDDIAGSKKAIDYLVELGHRKIAFLNETLEHRHGKQRYQGVKAAFTEASLEIVDDLFKFDEYTVESGYQLMQEVLSLPSAKQPTAIFAGSDNQAIGALEAIKEAGLSVPEDFALVGYDDIELARYLELTTVSQPMFEMGKSGVEILVKQLLGEQEEVETKEIEPKLIIRESC